MSVKYQKLHVGQLGFVIRSLGKYNPLLLLERCEIVEVEEGGHYIKVVFDPEKEPERMWNRDFIPANRRAIREAYVRILAVIRLGFRNAYVSPREPLISPIKEEVE